MSILEKASKARNTKLNKVETTKAMKMPMDVYTRLEEIAAAGYEGLAQEDSAYFLKCFGLFDKGEDFMLRVRVPAGQLNYEQALCIGEVAQKYGNDYIDLTTRMQVELRYLQIADIAKVLQDQLIVPKNQFHHQVLDNLENMRNLHKLVQLVHQVQGLPVEANPQLQPMNNHGFLHQDNHKRRC